jgi:hypothetical protein
MHNTYVSNRLRKLGFKIERRRGHCKNRISFLVASHKWLSTSASTSMTDPLALARDDTAMCRTSSAPQRGPSACVHRHRHSCARWPQLEGAPERARQHGSGQRSSRTPFELFLCSRNQLHKPLFPASEVHKPQFFNGLTAIRDATNYL